MGLPAEDDIVTKSTAPQAAKAQPEQAPENNATPEVNEGSGEAHVPMGESIDISVGEASDEEASAEGYKIKLGNHTINLDDEKIGKAFSNIIHSFRSRQDAMRNQAEKLASELDDLLKAKENGQSPDETAIASYYGHLEILGTMLFAGHHIIEELTLPSLPIALLPKAALTGFPLLLSQLAEKAESTDNLDLASAAATAGDILSDYYDTHQAAMQAGDFDDLVCECCRNECCGGESPEEEPAEEAKEEEPAAEGSGNQ